MSSSGNMSSLKQRLNVILELVPSGSEVVFMDYPVYENIGDLLILRSTEKFFQDNGITVVERRSIYDYDLSCVYPANVVIVCQGGGNFGDLYRPHQKLREDVINTFRRNRIIVLPQTVRFERRQNADAMAPILRSHPDLHLFVRDQISLNFLRNFAPRVYLSPDMAHHLWPIPNHHRKRKSSLFLQRTDHEQLPGCERHAAAIDWNDFLSPQLKGRLHEILPEYFSRSSSTWHQDSYKAWYEFADQLVANAIEHVSQYDRVITSRLHGYILARLLGIPVELMDNSYGKNFAYQSQWEFEPI